MAWKVTPRLVTLSPTHLLFLPALPTSPISNSFFLPYQLLAQSSAFLSFSQPPAPRVPITSQSCISLGVRAVKLGMLRGCASSPQSSRGAAQSRAGTGVTIQPVLQSLSLPSPEAQVYHEAKPAPLTGLSSIFNLLNAIRVQK